jgi:putative peptidoglycan lipid II flippase
VRAGYLELTHALRQSLTKFAITGVVLAAVLWLTARFAAAHLAGVRFQDEIILLLLIGVGVVVYAGSILGLFGWRWLKGLVKG